MPITITEALAEIKTIGKRIEAKRDHILSYLARQEGVKDPLEKDGGSAEMIRRERQSISDLEDRIVYLRRGILRANSTIEITINGSTRSIADWLTWRRDVQPGQQVLLTRLRAGLAQVRDQAKRQGVQTVAKDADAKVPQDLVVNIDEAELARQIETMEDTMGQLDGQLSLKNATVQIDG